MATDLKAALMEYQDTKAAGRIPNGVKCVDEFHIAIELLAWAVELVSGSTQFLPREGNHLKSSERFLDTLEAHGITGDTQ